jgi:hypothetical protein
MAHHFINKVFRKSVPFQREFDAMTHDFFLGDQREKQSRAKEKVGILKGSLLDTDVPNSSRWGGDRKGKE